MQTFLPYPSFAESVKVLDRQRLGKQRLETLQILKTLDGKSGSWKNHPAVKMWDGHMRYLALYGIIICQEWIGRGYKDSQLENIKYYFDTRIGDPPKWLGSPEFHASHRANLLRKNPTYYSQFGWTEDPSLPYIWPV